MRAASCKAGERTRARPWVLMFERISCCALAPWLGAHGVTRDYDLGFRRPGLMRGDRQALARRGPRGPYAYTYVFQGPGRPGPLTRRTSASEHLRYETQKLFAPAQ